MSTNGLELCSNGNTMFKPTDFPPAAFALDELASDGAVDVDGVAIGIVAADLALALAQEAVVAHPVGDVVRQPRATLRTVVVGARRADLDREELLAWAKSAVPQRLEPKPEPASPATAKLQETRTVPRRRTSRYR